MQGIELYYPEIDLYAMSVEKMIVDSEGVIYAATLSGYGLFRSMDGGNTWSQVNSEFVGLWITDLEVSNGGDLFVATYPYPFFRS